MAGKEKEKQNFPLMEYSPPLEVVGINGFCTNDIFKKFHIDGATEGNLGVEIRGYRKLKVASSKIPENLRHVFEVGFGLLRNDNNKIIPIVSNYRLEAANGFDRLTGHNTSKLLIIRDGIEKDYPLDYEAFSMTQEGMKGIFYNYTCVRGIEHASFDSDGHTMKVTKNNLEMEHQVMDLDFIQAGKDATDILYSWAK